MTLTEVRSISPPQVVQGHKDTAAKLSLPKPIGFNGGSTEKGIKDATVVPVFTSLGELVITSLKTSNIDGSADGEAYMGTKETCPKTCGYSCGGTCGNRTCNCSPATGNPDVYPTGCCM